MLQILTHVVEGRVLEKVLDLLSGLLEFIVLGAQLVVIADRQAHHTTVQLVDVINRGDDLIECDIVRRPRQSKAASSALGTDQKFLADEFLENLGHEMFGQIIGLAQVIEQNVAIGTNRDQLGHG